MRTNRTSLFISFLTVVLLVTGCAQKKPKGNVFSEHYQQDPKTILVLPPINQSTAAEAKQYYSTTIAPATTRTGYYVFPVEVISQMMKAEGSYHQNVKKIPPERFREEFGADAVLYITIKEWNTSYLVVAANVTVGLRYELVSTKSGNVIWSYEDTITRDTSGGSGGASGQAGLIVQAVTTAVETAATKYISVARDVNDRVLKTIPRGPYHDGYQKDKGQVINIDKIPTKRLRKNLQSSDTKVSSTDKDTS